MPPSDFRPFRKFLGYSEVYWPAWEMHCNNLRLVLGLALVRVSSRVRVRILVLWLGLALEQAGW